VLVSVSFVQLNLGSEMHENSEGASKRYRLMALDKIFGNKHRKNEEPSFLVIVFF
jgi:hypothetical protein